MATFKTVVRTKNEYNSVYIRITHNRSLAYIKTHYSVHKSGIRKGEVVDHIILANCALKIKGYIDKLNNVDIKNWTVGEVKDFLESANNQISFTDFASKYIARMKIAGRKSPANNYQTALNSLHQFYQKKDICFSDITSKQLRDWIDSLKGTNRAKQLYPIIIKKLFEEGCLEYNDYDRDIIKIANQPFKAVKIPSAETPQKRSTNASVINKILSINPSGSREELAHDIIYLVIYLVGINTVDLYHMGKSNYKDGKICYNRRKTANERKDKAYIEVAVNPIIQSLFEKYKGKKNLFNFSEKYSTSDIFSTAINKGLKSLCEKANKEINKRNEPLEKKEELIPKITVYWLRHTWATIAQNKCKASTELVAFCLNHISAHKVTEGYIEKDFSPIDKLNKKVMKEIFG